MLINKSNYEAFALDYIEGNLSGTDEKAMRDFLQAHPTIAEEVDSLRTDFVTLVPAEGIVYVAKENLLREETTTIGLFYRRSFQRWAVAATIALLLIGFGAGYFAAHQTLRSGGAVAITPPVNQSTDMEQTAQSPASIDNQFAVVETATDNLETIQSTENQQMATSSSTQKVATAPIPSVALEPEIATAPVKEPLPPLDTKASEAIAPPNINIKNDEPVFAELVATEAVATTLVPLPLLPEAPLTAIPTLTEDTVVIVLTTERLANESNILNRFGRLRQFMGRLPFDEVNLRSFVPSYFVDGE